MKLADESEKLDPASAGSRAVFLGRDGASAAYDLLKHIKDGKVKLEDLKQEELPKELAGKTLAEQKAFLEKIGKEREALSRRTAELDKMRSEFIARKIAEDAKLAGTTSFESRVLDVYRTQAARRR